MRAGLVGGEGFAIDASVIEADASCGRKVDGKLTTWPETEKLTRPEREYLAALDQAAREAAKTEDADDDMPPGNPPAPPKVTSPTDPTAAWTNKGQRKVGFAYGANYLIDLQQAIIVDVEATPARWSAEVAATKTMLERTQECFGLKPRRLAADAAYGSGLMIGWLMRRGIEPHIPLLDREHQTKGFFTRAELTFDPQANVFICPGEKQLRSTGLVREDGTMPYWASTKDCRACALKPRCTKGAKRIVTRNLFEAEREHVRALKRTEAFERSARERRRSKWRSPISNEIWAFAGCGCAGSPVPRMSFCSLPRSEPEKAGPVHQRSPADIQRLPSLNPQRASTGPRPAANQWISNVKTEPGVALGRRDPRGYTQPPLSLEFFNGILDF